MAYRRKATSRKRSAYSARTNRSAGRVRRTVGNKRKRASGTRTSGRAQTLRIVIEQPSAQPALGQLHQKALNKAPKKSMF